MADELNGHALPIHHTKPSKNYNFQNDDTTVLWSVTLKIGAASKLALFFPMVCFIHVFSQSRNVFFIFINMTV